MSLASVATAAVLLAASASAHFTLDYPTTIGFSDDDEGTGPCGGFTPDFSSDNITDFAVDGDNIALNLLHTQGNWLFRATLDESASSGWTQLFPLVQQTGLGYFCEPSVPIPSSWVGETGVLSAVLDGPDGILYQCASVKFVSGAATSTQSTCTNSSSVTFAFTTDSDLTALVSNSTSTSNTTATATSTSSATAATTTTSAAGRLANAVPLGSVVAAMALSLAGSAYMLL